MPRLSIIILDRPDPADTFTYRYVFWADVPAPRVPFYVKPAGTVSAWKDATTADNTAIQTGTVAELVSTINTGNRVITNPAIQATLTTRWTDFQTQVTNNNPWANYGTTWNGTAWVVGGVA